MATVQIDIPDEVLADIVTSLGKRFKKTRAEDDLEFLARVASALLVNSSINVEAESAAKDAATNKRVESKNKYKDVKPKKR